MDKVIYKYDLTPDDSQSIVMPCDAEILDVQMQHGELKLWAVVDTYLALEPRHFFIIGTGHAIPPQARNYKHLKTLVRYEGSGVLHVFEITRLRDSI